MNYLILYNGHAWYTNWYDVENNHMEGMVVFNLLSDEYSTDGIVWVAIEEDHL